MVFEFQVIQVRKKANKNRFGINRPTGNLYYYGTCPYCMEFLKLTWQYFIVRINKLKNKWEFTVASSAQWRFLIPLIPERIGIKMCWYL